jgi:pimeloyl-ACP methyl ester carboxylesterase
MATLREVCSGDPPRPEGCLETCADPGAECNRRPARRAAVRASGWIVGALLLIAAVAPAAIGADSQAQALAFEVRCTAAVQSGPITTRVYVLLGPESAPAEPRFGPNWFRPQPFFALDVKGWKPGEPLRIDSRAEGFPSALNQLEPGRYAIQAVVRLNRDTHLIGDGEGNAFGPVVKETLDAKTAGTIALTVDQVVPPRRFEETDRIKLVELPSPQLSAFHRRPIKHRAAVILPKDLVRSDHPGKRPTLYIIPGFGGDHFLASLYTDERPFSAGEDFLRVVLDPECGSGHHVFADSATNGPRGTALIEEFIPHLEKAFPALADPRARLLNGHSSGGWSSLWLQVTYPDVFGGTWSTSPDPVDFRDFQRVDIYATGENVYCDRKGNRRPIARMGVLPILFFDRFTRMDDVIGWGGQLGSFEAVFSPLGSDGRPRKLWDRSTGAIDRSTARAWESYDIRLILERNWQALGPRLKGKLHVIVGERDNFFLEGAVKLLKASLARLGSDAVVEIVPNRDHQTLLDVELAERFDREMKAAVGLTPARK